MKLYQIKIPNRFAALEDLSDSEDINRAWENVKENIKTWAKESLDMYKLKQHKPWFDEECVNILDRRKQAKMQWVQDPNQSNVDNRNNIRLEASRHFRNKNKEYLKAKVYELETNSKIRNIWDLCRDIIDLKKGYQPTTNIVTDEKGGFFTDCHSILARRSNHFSQLFHVHGVNDVRQAEIHTAEPLVPEPSAFDVEMAVEKLKRRRSPRIDQIPAELIKAKGRTIHSEIHKLLILFGISSNCLRSGKNRSLCLPIRRALIHIVVIIAAYHFLPPTYRILSNILLSRLTPYAEKITGDQCGFRRNRSTTDRIFCIRQILEEKWEYNKAAHQLFIDFKKAYDSVRREVLYNILIECGILVKLVRLIKMCLTERYSRVRVGRNLSDMLPIRSCLKQGDALSPLRFSLASEHDFRSAQVNSGTTRRLVYVHNTCGVEAYILWIKKADALIVASKETGLEVNGDKTKCIVMSRDQNAGRSRNIKSDNSSFEKLEQFKYLGTTLTN